MGRISEAGGVDATWTCDWCQKHLYCVHKTDVRSLPDGTLPIPPVVLLVTNKRWVFCCQSCALGWLSEQPERDLLGGFPLW